MAHILVRLSQRRDEEGGLERQEADCRSYCDRLGFPVEKVWREVQSAYAGKEREVLEAALEGAAGGHLVVWKIDRLTRRGVVGLSGILGRLEKDGTVLHSVTESIDARTPMGRAVLGVLAGVAEQSSADASLRIRRAFEEKAKAGERHPGGKGAFGWRDGEPELIREAVAWIVSGGSLRGLCADWNDRGIRTPTGKHWQSVVISRILRSERLIGIRVHKGERYQADWEPILTEAEFSAVGAALARNKKSPTGKRSLLQGLLVCGKCGGRMRATSATEKSGRSRYSCIKEPGKVNCGSNSTYRDLADKAVTAEVERVWAIWEAAAPAPVVDPAFAIAKEREALAQLVHDHYVSRLISRELFLPSYQELQDRIAELESQEVSPIGDAQTIEQKLKACVSHVEINTVKSGKERVSVHFRFGWLNQRVIGIV